MRNYFLLLAFFVLLASHTNSVASEGNGTIKEVEVCGYGEPKGSWRNVVLFKLSDGNWFGVYGNHGSTTFASSFDDTPSASLVMLAFSTGWEVSVRATYRTGTFCNKTLDMLWDNSGDYIRVKRP